MKYLIIVLSAFALCVSNTWAQEEPPEIDETEETDDPTVEEPVAEETLVINSSEQMRVARLAEASGKTTDEIFALRNGSALASTEDDETAVEAGKVRGWGQVAHMLGLHPGILGHGTGDKFMPDLPDIDDDAMEAVQMARERAVDRKTARKELKTEAKMNRRDSKAVSKRAKAAKKDKPAKPDKADKSRKPDKAAK